MTFDIFTVMALGWLSVCLVVALVVGVERAWDRRAARRRAGETMRTLAPRPSKWGDIDDLDFFETRDRRGRR